MTESTTLSWYSLTATERDVFRGVLAAQQHGTVGAPEIVNAVPGKYSSKEITETVPDLVDAGFVVRDRCGDNTWRPHSDGLRALEHTLTRDAQALLPLDESLWPIVPLSSLDNDDNKHHEVVQDTLETRTVTLEQIGNKVRRTGTSLVDEHTGPLRCTCGTVFSDTDTAYQHQEDNS